MANLPTLNISSAASSNLTNVVIDLAPDNLSVDSPQTTEETIWQNSEWTKQWGYFNSIPELHSAMIMKSIWNVGKGYTADAETKVILDHITGAGKDTFCDILFNMDLVARISGDAYAEIMRDESSGILINLKPLNPENIRVVYDKKGILKRYEQIIGGKITNFEPDEIFHLAHNRLADQIHGIS